MEEGLDDTVSPVSGGSIKWRNHFGNSVAIAPPTYILKTFLHMFSKDIQKNVQSTIHSSKNPGTSQMTIDRKVGE